MRGLESRLRRLEKMYMVTKKDIYIFVIDDGEEFETEEQLEQELKDPKYKDATIIVDNRKHMRWVMEQQKN